MNGFILGQKSIQSQTFNAKGERIPTTLINTTPCYVTQIKNLEKDCYVAVQLGFQKAKHIAGPVKGTLTKAGIKTPLRFLREFRVDTSKQKVEFSEENGKTAITIDGIKLVVGQEITPSVFFKVDEKVTVSSISKGKGFQGVVKRHSFKGGSKTHGQSDRQRAPGAIGMTTTPGRVFKGKRMAGRMGNDRVTMTGFPIVSVTETGIVIKGLVPGTQGALLEISK